MISFRCTFEGFFDIFKILGLTLGHLKTGLWVESVGRFLRRLVVKTSISNFQEIFLTIKLQT